MAKKAYIGVEKLTTTAVDLADVDSLQEFWVGRYDPYGNVPEWNSQSGGYEFSGNSVYAQDFYREINDGRLQVESNTIYFIPDSYPQYYVKVIYINYQQSLQPDEFIAYKTENKGVARKIKKGYVGVEQAASYALVSNGTRDFTDGSISVTSFSAYQINSNGTLTPGDPTTTTLDGLWQYIEAGAKDLYFYFTGESSITECYQLYNYGLGNRTEYVYSVDVYTVTGSNFVQVAHKIKKAYIGIGGVARPCWAGGTITKYGTIDATSDKIENSAGASNGDYAIFAGGRIYTATGNGTQTDSVFAYSKSLTLSKPDVLYTAVMDLSATNVGDYAVFAGGQLATTTDYKRYVTAYDKSLTRTFPSTLYNNACRMSAANAGGNYAVFVGGYPAEYGWTAYDSSLTMKTGDMANYRYSAAATSLGDCAVFAGGAGDGILSSCETIDSSLTRTTRGDLSVARYELSAAHVGKYAIFAGGYNQKGPVDVYNESFTRSALGNIATDGSRYHIAATQVDGFAIFAGGVYSLTVDLYDESLTHTLAENLTNDRAYSCAASVGDYALIFGGRGTLNGEDVEIYMLA